VQGSNDGSTWAVLDTPPGQAWTNNETLTFRAPVVSAAYRYYRLNITANNGDGTYTDIGERSLYQGTIVGGLTAQTITFPASSDGAANDPPFVLIGTSDSGLPLSYSVVSGPATISGTTGHHYRRRARHNSGRPGRERKLFRRHPGQSVLHGCSGATREYRLRPDQGIRIGRATATNCSRTAPPRPWRPARYAGQVAFDAAGYRYFCYGVNQWGRIEPTGYGSAAASPSSW
jgi:hypothetical protein